MTASKGFIGKGTVFSIGIAGSPETWTPIAQLKTAAFAGQKLNFDDITNLDSPNLGTSTVATKEFLPSLVDPGTISLGGIFLPVDGGYLAFNTAYQAAALTDFKIVLPKGPGQTTSGNQYAFSGYIVEAPLPDVQFDKALTWKTTIQITTPITLTPGT